MGSEESGSKKKTQQHEGNASHPGKEKKEYNNRGSVLFSRKWLGNNLARHPSAFTIYFHLVGWANHENGRLNIGQVALGERDFGERIGMSITTVRKWLRWLRDNDWITVKATRRGKVRGSVVTILRYVQSQSFSTYKLPSEDQKLILTPASEDQEMILTSEDEDQKMILTPPVCGSENDPSYTPNSIRDSVAAASHYIATTSSEGGEDASEKRCSDGLDQEGKGIEALSDPLKTEIRAITEGKYTKVSASGGQIRKKQLVEGEGLQN